MTNDEEYLKDLSLLKNHDTKYPQTPDGAPLETFANRFADRDFWITFECPEFTSVCPVTGQPDFGTITIRYIPDQKCIESKALKLYMFSFRNHDTFYEEAVNRILDDVVAACDPRECVVVGDFTPRGGIGMTIEVTHSKSK